MMKFEDLEKIFLLFQNSNLSKFKWVLSEKEHIILEKGGSETIHQVQQLPQQTVQYQQQQPNYEIVAPSKHANTPDPSLHFIISPLVGTFYRSASPDSPPLVKEGDKITKGKVICIIEAMKLMNEIESDVDGVVIEVLIENSNSVEFGSKLFAIKTIL